MVSTRMVKRLSRQMSQQLIKTREQRPIEAKKPFRHDSQRPKKHMFPFLTRQFHRHGNLGDSGYSLRRGLVSRSPKLASLERCR